MRLDAYIHQALHRHRILALMILCLLGLCMVLPAHAQRKGRIQDERIYLDHADSLYYDEFRKHDTQQQENTFQAFGHVRLLQGDTLEVRCDTAFYDGRADADMVHAQHHVVVIHRKTSELRTDNLILDQKFNVIYYDEGGNFTDKAKGMTLSSDWGKYNLDTKEAEFFYKVKLRTKTHVITTDTLFYYSADERAHVKGGKTEFNNGQRKWSKSTIHSIRDGYDVETTNCVYFMKTDKVELYDKSSIQNEIRTITGDSLYYDSSRKVK